MNYVRIIAACALLGAITANADPIVGTRTPPVPGNYNTFVLAMSDESDFCAYLPGKKECQEGAGSWGMALHGLWPDQVNDPQNAYQYCSSVTAQEVGSNWCAPNVDVGSKMNPSTLTALSSVMPGVGSCLYTHEWYAHGTCSGMQIDSYFETATYLAAWFRLLPNFNSFIARSAGQTVSRSQLIYALALDLGAGAEEAAIMLCRKDAQNQFHFSEVDITLNLRNLLWFPNPVSLARSKPTVSVNGAIVPNSGSCPVDGIQITAASGGY